MSIRSTILAKGIVSTAAAWQTLATVPAGEIWLVKSIYLWNGSGASSAISCRLQDSVTGALAFVVDGTFASGVVPAVTLWIVAEPPVKLQLLTSLQPVYYWWSGARLA